jgi:hypothetical protein
MSKIRLAGISALALVSVCATLARATDISAKKIFIKESKQVQVLSVDSGVHFADAVDPAANGASLHVYSATDDLCVTLPSGADWKNKKNKLWKYKSKATKNSAQLKDGKLLITIKSGVTYTLSDNGTQGAVNAQAQFGTGTRFCMRCTGAKKDTASKFLGKNCVAAPCSPEPSACGSATTPTTIVGATSTTSTASTTTMTGTTVPGQILKGALTATPGRFNYNLTLGLPGANAACNTTFPGTHACTYAELQSAEAAGDLDGLRDTANFTVTAFWAIDNSQPALQQCQDDAAGGSNLNWEYGTAHTASRGQKVSLNNGTGALGALQSSLQCNFSGNAWVGCCQ